MGLECSLLGLGGHGMGVQFYEGCLITPVSSSAILSGLGVARAEGIRGLTPQGNRFSSDFKRMWAGLSVFFFFWPSGM